MKQSFKYIAKSVLFSLLASVVLMGCSTETGTIINQSKSRNTDKVYELNVGYSQGNGAVLFDVAEQAGFFKDENLKVNGIGFASSADGLNALQAGKIDLGMTFGTAAPLTFISKGSEFSIIGGHLEGGHPILVQAKDKDKYISLQDYKGKKVGTIRMFTSDIVFRGALTEAGIDWKKDLDIIEFKTPGDLIQAISSGKIDVAVSAGSTYLKAKESNLVAVAWSNDLNPTHTCCRVVTRKVSLETDEGEAYKRFLKALIRAERVKNEHPEEAVKAAKKHLKMDDVTVNSIINEEHAHYSPDPNSKEVKKMWEEMKSIGYIKNSDDININNYINLTLYEKALNELIQEYPQDQVYYQKQLERFKKQN